MSTLVSQPSLFGTENSGSSAREAGPAAAMPAMVSASQDRATMRLWARTQRVRADMPASSVGGGVLETPWGWVSASPHGGRATPPEGRSQQGFSRVRSPQMAERNDLLIDVGLAVVAFAASVGMLAADEVTAGGVALTALASLPLVARRRAPMAVFVVTTLASSGVHLVADPIGPPLGPTIALYTLAESGAGIRRMAVVAAGYAVHLAAVATGGDDVGAGLLFGIVLWTGTWIAGDRTRLRRERLAELEERAFRAEREADRERRLAAAEERMRIARDLHDSAGHAINVILVHAGAGRLHASDPERAREAFATIEEVARETVGEIDQLVAVLREAGDGTVEPPPGVAALDGLVARHRAAGVDVTATVEGDRSAVVPSVDRGAYRILQEALTNAARHGDGSAEVHVVVTGRALQLTVANPVRGDG